MGTRHGPNGSRGALLSSLESCGAGRNSLAATSVLHSLLTGGSGMADNPSWRRQMSATAIAVWVFAIVEAIAIGIAFWLR